MRAIFDDAGNVIAGEDVKIAGVKVGTVGSVTPTPQAKAAVVLNITNPGFQDFRADASCTIRPQALIGEKYVDCLPTQPRVEGTPLPPPLHEDPARPRRRGQYLLPVTNTNSPVDVDLLGDINRLPERQRLTIILNELGAGPRRPRQRPQRRHPPRQPRAAGIRQGAERSSPSENKVLAQLAVDSDKALAPFARVREHVADFIVAEQHGRAGERRARAARWRATSQLFPPFLRTARPGDGTPRTLRRRDARRRSPT